MVVNLTAGELIRESSRTLSRMSQRVHVSGPEPGLKPVTHCYAKECTCGDQCRLVHRVFVIEKPRILLRP